MAAPLLPHLQVDLERERKAHVLAIVAESESSSSTPLPRFAGGDRRQLRGVPICARGVDSSVPGTRPDLLELDSD